MMSLLTETELRFQLKGENLGALQEYRVKSGTKITPSAQEFLKDHKIVLVYGDEMGEEIKTDATVSSGAKMPSATVPEREQAAAAEQDSGLEKASNLPAFVPPKRYETATGAYYDEKPEHMTAIRGPKLVNKDHPVIRFRGKIDSLEARIVEVQLAFHKLGLQKVVEDLGTVLAYTQEILRCEVLNCELEEQILLGMDSGEIRARSHTPKKYYGINHFAASLEHGEGVILLNTLRTQVREVELAAYDTFKDEYGVPQRPDIMRGLNRLSSLFYVMMFKMLAKEYES